MAVSYREMNQAAIDELLSAPRFGVLGTNRKNGPPQLTPVWYLYEAGRIYVSMTVDSYKYRNLLRDPRATLCISAEHPDARAVVFSGSVELHLQRGEPWVEDIAWRIVRRYYDTDQQARDYLESDVGDGENALAVLLPDRVMAHDYN